MSRFYEIEFFTQLQQLKYSIIDFQYSTIISHFIMNIDS